MSKIIAKYRPYLSADQMLTILKKFDSPESPLEASIKSYFHLYLLKVGLGVNHASYIPAKPSLDSQLGFNTDSMTVEDKELFWFKKWQENPTQVMGEQLDLVNQHRYTNNLMSEFEAAEYEKRLFSF